MILPLSSTQLSAMYLKYTQLILKLIRNAALLKIDKTDKFSIASYFIALLVQHVALQA